MYLLLACSSTIAAQAQSEDSLFIRKLATEILENSKAYENLRVLTKTIGGRLAGSPQMVKAEIWGLKAMKAAGDQAAYMQECMVPHWVRGGQDKATAIVGKTRKQLDVVALGNTVGTMKPLTAPVISIHSFEELEQKKEAVKNKIVYFDSAFNDSYVRTFQAYGETGRFRREGPARAARYGASAVLIRSLSHSTDNHPHTGSTTYADSVKKIPAAALGLKDADWLEQQLKKGPVSVTLHTHGKMLPDTIGHNIIGEIKGTEFPNEFITVGGHLDSWDNCEGAHDDGAGCVQTIEVLRALKVLGYQPKRTIRFVLFANEENGVRGGNKYAEEAKAKGEQHIFALETDAGGFTPRGFGFTASDAQLEKVRRWQNLLAPYGANELNKGGGGTDIGPLNRLLGTALAGLQPDSQRYFDYHHARSDVFEAVNKRELELGAVNIAALIYLVDKYGL